MTTTEQPTLKDAATAIQHRRKLLKAHVAAARDIERADLCVSILERMEGATPQRCIAQLKHYSRRKLTTLDGSAAKLGAPYPDTQEYSA